MEDITKVETKSQNPSQAISTAGSASLPQPVVPVSNEECLTKLITDSPADHDKFGPHERIASAIANLVQSPNESGVAIGLEGEWGSGKSTVVELLKAELHGNKNYTLVLFNAWAHEGDPLRRTFLETLIQHLIEIGWLEGRENEWREQQDIIAQRKEKKRTTTEPYLTTFGKLIGSSFLLIPFGTTFLGKAIDNNNRFSWPPDWYLTLYGFLGVLLTLAPVWLLLLLKGLQLIRNEKLQGWLQSTGQKVEEEHCPNSGTIKTASSSPDGQKREASLWHMIFNKVVTEEQTITTKTPNPTAIEFEDTFKHLMRDALTSETGEQAESRHIVIVLDNLDRIAPGDALSIWSTLQTFLKQRSNITDRWFKRVWILVPYDRQGLSQLWENDKVSQGSNAASFMDKSFQVRFEVPPPVPSDWRKFLIGLLEQAFPGHQDESEFHKVYRALALHLRQISDAPTIRELKLYVNQVGSIYRQWNRIFPLSHLAYFAILRRPEKSRLTGIDIAQKLVTGSFPEPAFVDLLGKEIVNSLAALHFNVAVDKAQQLLLKDPIRMALTLLQGDKLESKAEVLVNLSKLDGFWAVLIEFIETEWAATEATVIANAAQCLKASGLMLSGGAEIEDVKAGLKRATSAVKSWAPIDSAKADGLAALFELIGDESFGIEMLNKTTTSMVEAEAARQSNPDEETVKSNTPIWAKDLQAMRERIVVSLNWTGVFEKGVIEPLFQGLRTSEHFGDAYAKVLLETLCELRMFDGEADRRLRLLVKEGHITRRLVKPEHLWFSVTALSLFAFFLNSSDDIADTAANNNLNIINKLFNERSDYDWMKIAEPFTDYLVHYQELQQLFKLTGSADSKAFVEACFRRFAETAIAEGADADLKLDPKLIIKHWEFLKEINSANPDVPFNETPGEIVRRFIKGTKLVSYLCQQNFDIAQADIYSIINASADEEQGTEFRRWVLDGLQEVTVDEWLSQLHANSHLIHVTGDLLGLALQVSNGLSDEASGWLKAYEEGLLKYIEENIGDPDANFPPGPYQFPILAKDSPARKSFRQKLYELAAANAKSDIAPAFFRMYAAELSDPEIVGQNVRKLLNITHGLIKQRHIAGLEWLADLLSNDAAHLGKLAPEIMDDLKVYVLFALNKNLNDGASSAIQRIVDILKLNDPAEVAASYTEIIARLTAFSDYDYLQALSLMVSTKSFFSLPGTLPPELIPIQDELKKLSERPVNDDEGLKKRLIGILESFTHLSIPPKVNS